MQHHLADTGIPLLTIGFSPPPALVALAEFIGLTGLMLADEQRVLYRLLGLRRAPLWQIYSPGTLAYYATARARGRRLHRPVEDTRQLGGDVIVGPDCRIILAHCSKNQADRPSVETLSAAIRAASSIG